MLIGLRKVSPDSPIDECMFALILALLSAQCTGPDRELSVKSGFALCHGVPENVPVWTLYELTPDRIAAVPVDRPKRFRRDTSLTQPGATHSDYRNSGWSRGRMVPASDMAFSEEAMRDLFLLSNTVPQDPSLNLSAWRRIENRIRTVPPTRTPRIGSNRVAPVRAIQSCDRTPWRSRPSLRGDRTERSGVWLARRQLHGFAGSHR